MGLGSFLRSLVGESEDPENFSPGQMKDYVRRLQDQQQAYADAYLLKLKPFPPEVQKEYDDLSQKVARAHDIWHRKQNDAAAAAGKLQWQTLPNQQKRSGLETEAYVRRISKQADERARAKGLSCDARGIVREQMLGEMWSEFYLRKKTLVTNGIADSEAEETAFKEVFGF